MASTCCWAALIEARNCPIDCMDSESARAAAADPVIGCCGGGGLTWRVSVEPQPARARQSASPAGANVAILR